MCAASTEITPSYEVMLVKLPYVHKECISASDVVPGFRKRSLAER